MEMFIRTIVLYLNYLRYRILYNNRIWFRGFSVIYAMKESTIIFNNHGG